jgi:hypothetical protein
MNISGSGSAVTAQLAQYDAQLRNQSAQRRQQEFARKQEVVDELIVNQVKGQQQAVARNETALKLGAVIDTYA